MWIITVRGAINGDCLTSKKTLPSRGKYNIKIASKVAMLIRLLIDISARAPDHPPPQHTLSNSLF